MIGSYLDKQVTQIKNGVLAAGSLLGIGLIIYFVVTKRKSIGSALGLGNKTSAEQVDLDVNKQIEHHPENTTNASDADESDDDQEVIEIEEDDDDDSDDGGNNASVNN